MSPYGNLGARQPEHDHLELRRENFGENRAGGGAVFRFTLPLARTDAAVSHEYAGFELGHFGHHVRTARRQAEVNGNLPLQN